MAKATGSDEQARGDGLPTTAAGVRVDLVVLACAVSAGIHAALVPDHLAEGAGPGIGFAVAAGLLLVAAVVSTRRPSQLVLLATAGLFAGLIVSYALVLVVGLPLVHPEREAVDGLALATKAVEAGGLVLAASLVRRPQLALFHRLKGTLVNTTRSARPVPLVLIALVTLFSALVALAVSGGMNMAQAHSPAAHAHAVPADPVKSVAFHADMRKLWEDHITWTRLAIISLEGGTPDTDATVARLLRNQVDIGNAIKPFYGARAGNELTRQLRNHILIAADVIAAAKAGDQAKLADAQKRWVANADTIATVLHSVNPGNWPLAVLKSEMHMHLKLTTEEAVAHLQGKWAADVAAYDRVHVHILHMSDVLADGIVAQFPARFAG